VRPGEGRAVRGPRKEGGEDSRGITKEKKKEDLKERETQRKDGKLLVRAAGIDTSQKNVQLDSDGTRQKASGDQGRKDCSQQKKLRRGGYF